MLRKLEIKFTNLVYLYTQILRPAAINSLYVCSIENWESCQLLKRSLLHTQDVKIERSDISNQTCLYVCVSTHKTDA